MTVNLNDKKQISALFMRRLAARGYLRNRQKTRSDPIQLDYSSYMFDNVGHLDAFDTVIDQNALVHGERGKQCASGRYVISGLRN